jgi:predicted MFS family arabinose efflux permease
MLGRYREFLWLGWILAALGIGVMCILDVDTSVPAWIFINVAPGLGLGVLIPAQLTAIQAATDNKSAGYAVSMSMLVRSSGEALGVAIGGVVFQNILRQSIGSSAVRNVVTVDSLIRTMHVLQAL